LPDFIYVLTNTCNVRRRCFRFWSHRNCNFHNMINQIDHLIIIDLWPLRVKTIQTTVIWNSKHGRPGTYLLGIVRLEACNASSARRSSFEASIASTSVSLHQQRVGLDKTLELSGCSYRGYQKRESLHYILLLISFLIAFLFRFCS